MPQAEHEDAGGAVERMLAIKTLPLLGDVDPDELAIVADHAHFCTFSRGETLFSGKDAPVTRIHLVLEGRVVEHRAGRPFRTHGPQHVVGGVDALARSTADVTAIAEEETRTLAIERDDLRDVLEDNFAVLSAALQGVAATTLRLRRGLVPAAGFAPPRADEPEDPTPLDDLGARIAFLARRTWLDGARIRTLGQLAGEADRVALADGEGLFAEGDPADYAAVVVGGRLACESADGRHRFVVGRGAIVGFDETLAAEPRWCTVRAQGPASCLRIARTALLDALEDDADTALEILATVARVASELRDAAARGDEA